ncbi:VOC family protein [Shimazuella kribbensis]|uniref:VOC family protein n=1 Tax=Shimazuella kribbensis TaxID=139808 RepID=UPI0004010305|nr:VOC family protein [Shimazuella kribbensis]
MMTFLKIKLLFDTQAKDAATFYSEIFQDSKLERVTYYPKERDACESCGIHPAKAGTVMNVDFEIAGTFFTAINGKRGPEYAYVSSISLLVNCKDMVELTELYNVLSTDGEILSSITMNETFGTTAFVQDKFGVCWRLVVPEIIQPKIIPLLSFSGERSGQAKEAVTFYTNLFKESRNLCEVSQKSKQLMQFFLANQPFIGMDTHENFPDFTEAISFIILCDDQEEVDYYWQGLLKEGNGFYREASAWLVDQYGIWWQIITSELTNVMRDPEHLPHMIEEIEKTERINVKQILGKSL